MDRDKYITQEEKKLVSDGIKEQLTVLLDDLRNDSKFQIKREIDHVIIMKEEGELNGDE